MSSPEPIAIIGTGCRFPGGSNSPSKLWDLLRNPRDVLQKVPSKRRWNPEAFFHEDNEHHGTSNVQSSYFVDDDPADFDNNFFNIQPAEAEAIDPQQRMLVETVYESLCSAGQTIEGLRGTPTAIIVGAMGDDWSGALYKDWETLPQYVATGMGRSIMSNRISYFFDWHGASITLDTACSSSLVAVHLCIQAIRNGDSRVAVAAGTNLILTPALYLAESNLHMVSTSGRSKMWDSDVDGYGRGEGVAAIVMKSLSAAIADGDHIECIIRATSINQDGKTSGMTMPNPLAQASLIRDTYARAGLDLDNPAHRPQFFHAHGTGTPAGDPREAEAISRAFYSNGADDKLYVGSIKTIIGHTEGTAGLASLIGSVLSVKHGVILPNMHFNELSPKVAPFYDHLEVPTTAKPWPTLPPGQPRRASINSFGFGGTNAHAIIESYEPGYLEPSTGPVFTPLTVSGATGKSLRELLSSYSYYLKENPYTELRDFAYTLQERRSTLAYRNYISASTIEEASEKFDALVQDEKAAEFNTKHFAVSDPRILGVFTGQGAQWPRMGAKLVEMSPLVSRRLDELDAILASLPKTDRPRWTLREQLLMDSSSSRIYEAALSQPLCTAVQILLIELLELAGIKLQAVVGHSSGEIAAAYAAGFLSARDAIVTAYYRGYYTHLAKSPNGAKGAMMAVGTSLEDASEFCELDVFEGKIQIAAQNSPSSITLTGDEDAIDMAAEIFKDEGKFARKLKVDTAYHSAHMLPCAGPYLASMDVVGQDVSIPKADAPVWYSSVHEGRIMSAEDLSPRYWVQNLTNTVLFSPAISEAAQQSGPFDLAIEIGPHPALKGPCLDSLEEAIGDRVPYTGVLARGKEDNLEFSNALGFAWSNLGPESVSFEKLEKAMSDSKNGRQVISDIPNYPWDHSRKYWNLSRLSGMHMNVQTPPHPLLGRRCVDRDTSDKIQWRNMLKPKEIPWLHSHQLQGQIVFPASAYISMAIEAVVAVADQPKELSMIKVEDFVIDRAIPFLDENFVVESLFILEILSSTDENIRAKFSLYAGNPYDGSKPMTIHASGDVSVNFNDPRPDELPFAKAEQFNMASIDVDRFYGQFEPVKYQYAPPFRGIRSIKRKAGYATGTLEDQTGSEWADQLLIHPAMLDCAFQTGFAAWCCPGDGQMWCLHVPSQIRSITINPYFTSRGIGKQKMLSWESGLESYKDGLTTQDTTVFSEDGYYTFMQIQGLDATQFSAAKPEDDFPIFSRFDYRVDRPSGEIAAINDPPVLEVDDGLIESERLAFYYLRRLTETITREETDNTLPHYQHVLNWAQHVVEEVKNGKNTFLPVDCLDDTEDRFEPFLVKNGHRVDIRLIQSVGRNLPKVIRERSSILEHMTKDGMLDSIYEEGLGLDQPNRCMARMAAQIAHRYPRMNILEIGAGTGGSTRYIVPKLGELFSTYTYTDVSSGFFEAAQERFKDYASRMVYKTYNMEGAPETQGFVEGAYDLVVASYVLHVSDELEQMMTNIRSLLKPGGYIIIQELTSNDVLRINLPMSGLPGWWTGAENDRPWGPALSLSQWDGLLRKCGFSGIDSVTPRNHALYPDAVFVSQAVDDRVNLIRSPLSSINALPVTTTPQLLVVGGEKVNVQRLSQRLDGLLAQRYSKVVLVNSFKDLSAQIVEPSSTVVVLSELDEPLMEYPTPEKHEALQILWRQAGMVLWVCQGSRAEAPHSFMTVGLGRGVRYEYPNITLQVLDLDKVDADSAPIVAGELLRLETLAIWEREINRQDLLWSIEPEVYMESGVRMIPRLSQDEVANDRYNTARRTITKDVDPQKTSLSFASSKSSYEAQCVSPLRLPTLPPVSGDTRVIRVTHFLLQTIEVATAGRFMLVSGFDEVTGDKFLALSHALESPVPVLADFTVALGDRDPQITLAAFAAQILAVKISKLVPRGGTLLVHEPDEFVASALIKQAKEHSITLALTTSLKKRVLKGWQYIDEQLPHRYVARSLPASPSVFLDMSPSSSGKGGNLIADCIPEYCATYNLKALFGSKVELRPEFSAQEVVDHFNAAWLAISASQTDGKLETPVIPLGEVSSHSATGEHLAVVDCCTSLVSASIQAIDSGVIFRADKTYFLVGLAAEVGQSICQWMVKHGARYVVMTSRRPKVNPKFIQSLEALGATIKVLPCDVTKRNSLQRCYEEVCQTMPPIAGVANGAMVLRDALFDKMTFDELTMVLNPKVIGTQLLDEIFFNTTLDFFIVLSSLTATVGNSGQNNYTCANMYMVALTAQRKKRGLAGSAMAMSSLIGLGFVERSEELDEDYFAKLGHKNISERDLHLQFAEAIVVGRPEYTENSELVSGLVPIYADAQVKARWRTDARFNHFVMERPGSQTYAGQVVDTPIRVKLADTKDLQTAAVLIKDSFVARLKRIMMISDEENVNEKASLVEQGIDSLMAVEIRTWFLKELEVDMPVLKVISGGSILDLLAHALENLPKSILDVTTLESAQNTKPAPPPAHKPSSQSTPDWSSPSLEPSDSLSDDQDSSVDFTSQSTTPQETPMTDFEDGILGVPKKSTNKEISSRMSFGQERFWFLDSYLEDKKTFNMAMMFKLTGTLNVSRVEEALETVTKRHESLRTRFFWSNEGEQRIGMQGVLSDFPIRLVSKSIASESEAEQEMQKMYASTWDLNSWETVKISLLSLSDNVHYFVCGTHHISMDGYSLSLLFVELEFAYSGRPLPPVGRESQCRSLATEQRHRYEFGKMKKSIDYYRSLVPTDLKPIQLFPFATSKTRPVLDHYGQVEAKVTLESSLASKIKQLARKNGSTSFHLYLAALQALIFRLLPDMDDFFIGIADANRMNKNYMYSLGFFLNLLPLRFTRSNSGAKFGDIITETRNKAYSALQHSDVPFDVVLQELQVPRSNTNTPIFQVFVDYRQVYQERALWGGCKTSAEKWCNARTGYDVALEITENATGPALLSLRLQEGLYSKQSTDMFLRSYVNLLHTLTQNHDITVNELPCWDNKDIEKAFKIGKGPEMKPEWPATISHRVDQMIATNSVKLALKDGLGNTLTYADLGARVNTIATALVSAGATAKTPIAVFQDPSSDWICSMLAIFRVGATYIPLDLRNSIVRLISIVKTSRPVILLTDASTTTKTSLIGADKATEIKVSELVTSHSLSLLSNNAKAEDPAVVLFTSGTTGEPKGVIMNHSNIVAECEAYSKFCNLPAGNAVVMQQSIFSFDFSIEQTFAALADGGCLYVVPADKRGDPQEISKIMVEQGVTYTSGTPSEYEMLFKYASENLAKCTTWKYAFGGGEYLSPGLIRQFAKLPLPNLKLFNNYGPAEVTTAALKGELKYRDADPEEHTMAGFVLPNYQLYFLDKSLNPVPVGVPGEIVVGGPGVTAGYLGLEELTKSHYISDKFDLSSKDARLYRTGDLGHLADNGAVYWDGRIEGDTQVKLRGFRVELSEVEAVLVKHSIGALSHAVVTVRGTGEDRFLAAHVVFASDYPQEKRQGLIKTLETTLPLPQYMRPSIIISLADKPLTAHWKLDRKVIEAMPLPGGNSRVAKPDFLTETEAQLAELWQRVVPHNITEEVASETNFFNIGGNSLLLVRLQSLVKSKFGLAPRLIDLMNSSTLAEMSRAVDTASKAQSINWEVETNVPLAMQRLSQSTNTQPLNKTHDLTVVLAGATGYLGRHLLSVLVEAPEIREVVCLSRSGSLAPKSLQSHPKVRFITADLSEFSLGLSEATFTSISQIADVVVDCAANRSFWDSYENLKPVNFSGVKELVRLAQANNAHFHFLSSSAVQIYNNTSPPVDGTDGYVASKWAAESFLRKASEEIGISTNIYRPAPLSEHLGELSTKGSAKQALEGMINLAFTLGRKPDFSGVSGYVDLLPVDDMTESIATSIVNYGSKAGVETIAYEGKIRMHIKDLAETLKNDARLSGLPPMSSLDWFGEVKKAGFEYFITSQHLVMYSESGELLSRR